MKRYTLLLSALTVLALSCSKQPHPDSVKATFRDATGTDGCGMVIELTDGQFIEPKNLHEFDLEPHHGDKIWVRYHLATSGGSICMIGDIVVIDHIAKR